MTVRYLLRLGYDVQRCDSACAVRQRLEALEAANPGPLRILCDEGLLDDGGVEISVSSLP
jgi:hypothetical protein